MLVLYPNCLVGSKERTTGFGTGLRAAAGVCGPPGESWAVKMFLERAAVTRSSAPASGDDYFKSLSEGQRKRLDSMFEDCMEACEKARAGQMGEIDRINNAKL